MVVPGSHSRHRTANVAQTLPSSQIRRGAPPQRRAAPCCATSAMPSAGGGSGGNGGSGPGATPGECLRAELV
jgi:hypothetical protein